MVIFMKKHLRNVTVKVFSNIFQLVPGKIFFPAALVGGSGWQDYVESKLSNSDHTKNSENNSPTRITHIQASRIFQIISWPSNQA